MGSSSESKYYVYLNESVPHTLSEVCESLCKIIDIHHSFKMRKKGLNPSLKENPENVRNTISALAVKYDFLLPDEKESKLIKLLESFLLFVPLTDEDEPKDTKLIKLCEQYQQLLNDPNPMLSFGECSMRLSEQERDSILHFRFNAIVDYIYMSRTVGTYHLVPQIMAYFSLFDWSGGNIPETLEVRWIPSTPKYSNNYNCIDRDNRPISISKENLDFLIRKEKGPRRLKAEGNHFIRLASASMATNGFFSVQDFKSSKRITQLCCFLYSVGKFLGFKFEPIPKLNQSHHSEKEKQRIIRDQFKKLIFNPKESSK